MNKHFSLEIVSYQFYGDSRSVGKSVKGEA